MKAIVQVSENSPINDYVAQHKPLHSDDRAQWLFWGCVTLQGRFLLVHFVTFCESTNWYSDQYGRWHRRSWTSREDAVSQHSGPGFKLTRSTRNLPSSCSSSSGASACSIWKWTSKRKWRISHNTLQPHHRNSWPTRHLGSGHQKKKWLLVTW